MNLVFAKKCILPTGAANVLQSLNMAAAFSQAGAQPYFFPGVKGRSNAERLAAFRAALEDSGIDPAMAERWSVVPGNHAGVYGARFRVAMAVLRYTLPDAVFYARDIKEALFIGGMNALPGRRQRFVFEMHELLHEQRENASEANALKKMERAVLERVDAVVVINASLADKVRDIFGFKGPVDVAMSAYNPAIFPALPLFSEECPWPDILKGETLTLVYLGRFHEGKGVENLVGAMEFLPPSVHLRVIGGSPRGRFDALKEQAARIPDGTKRITFTGSLTQKDVAQACYGAHIFVIPQSSEKFYSPLKLYEALALGMPVLTTPLDAFAVQRAQNLVAVAPGGDARGIAQGVLHLAENRALAARLRENGLAAAKTATWLARAERIVAFCKSLGR